MRINLKSVNYFGFNLLVPEWVKYLACDPDGQLWGYAEQPFCNQYVPRHQQWTSPNDKRRECICNVALESHDDWTATCIDILKSASDQPSLFSEAL